MEDIGRSRPLRAAYLDGVGRYIESEFARARAEREAFMTPEKYAASQETYRAALIRLLGRPLRLETPAEPPRIAETVAERTDAYTRSEVQIEALPGIKMSGLLFRPRTEAPRPLVIALHGGGGTPELSAGLHGKNNYGGMTMRAVARGAVVFAPQLLLWNAGEALPTCPAYGVPYQRGLIDARLKHTGGSLIALELACLRRCLDGLLGMPCVARDRAGVIGLSYGGMYALYLAAVDTRLRAAYSIGYFSDSAAYPHADMLCPGAAGAFQNAELAALCAPRALYIEVGEKDTALPPGEAARADYLRARAFYGALGAEDNIRFAKTGEGHTMSAGDEGLDFLFGALTEGGR